MEDLAKNVDLKGEEDESGKLFFQQIDEKSRQ